MSSNSLTVMVPPTVAIPRGAQWAADAAARLIDGLPTSAPRPPREQTRTAVSVHPGAWLRRVGLAVWDAMQARGEARAARELRRLAELHETSSPDLARDLRAALARMGTGQDPRSANAG
jgi:hypothetical protein